MRLLFISSVAMTAAALSTSAAFVACTSSGSGGAAGPVDAGDANADGPSADAGADADAGASTCAQTRAYLDACKQDPTCGPDKFDAWCQANDQAINSAAFRRAEAMCLTVANCDGNRRRDCEYKSYPSASPTTAEQTLVAAYCQTCEPTDTAGCASRAVGYDALGGPAAVTDIFVAAWELADGVADEIRAKCTGSALDGGADAGDGGCAKAFGGCSADVYLAHVPDCPP